MREIKFRVLIDNRIYYQDKYDKYGDNLTSIDVCKKTITITEFYDYKDVYRFEYKEVKLMQYTGVKDKNGTEIYEGDIVILNDAEEESRCVVKYKYGSYILVYGDLRENLSNVEDRFLKVIGNIYENKNLLEEQK
mgnify:CR=1 FL=1|jgi:uncharacterized phage protein (TIGR01671 family)